MCGRLTSFVGYQVRSTSVWFMPVALTRCRESKGISRIACIDWLTDETKKSVVESPCGEPQRSCPRCPKRLQQRLFIGEHVLKKGFPTIPKKNSEGWRAGGWHSNFKAILEPWALAFGLGRAWGLPGPGRAIGELAAIWHLSKTSRVKGHWGNDDPTNGLTNQLLRKLLVQ